MSATKESREIAAQAWCRPETSSKVMDTELAEAFAEVLDEQKGQCNQPHLGLATTAQLLDELSARAEVGGYANYRTVDSD